jgi:hypothetical protein
MAQIGSLSVKLGLVTVEWDKATENAKRSAKDLQTQFNSLGDKVKSLSDKFNQFSGVGAALGFGFLYHEAVALTDELDDLSKSFGLSVSEVLTFRDALEQSGGKADGAGKAINTLFGKIADAKTGNDSAIAQFEKLGITFDELKKLSPYEAIQKVASGLSNITDQFEKTKAIKEVFGKAGIGVDLKAVADALKENTGQFDKYNESIKKVGQVSDALKKNLTNLTIAFADLIAPFSQSNIVKIETFSAALKGIAAGAAVASIGAMATSFVNLAVAIRSAAAAGALFNLTAGGATPIGLIIKAVTAAAAIGTFIYVSGSATNESGNLNSDFDKFAAAEERKRRLALGQMPNQSPYVGKTANLGTLTGRPIEEHGQYLPQREESTSTKPLVSNAVSNDAKALGAQISLTKQLIELDRQKNAFNMDTSKTELEKKIFEIEIERQKKVKQASAEAAQKVTAGGDTMTAALKSATYGEASAKEAKANQEAKDAKALANLQDRLRLNKNDIEQEKQKAEITLDSQKNAYNMDLSKTELEKKLFDIDIERQKKIVQIDADAKQKMATGSNTAAESMAEAATKKAKVNQEADDAKALAKQADRIRLTKDAADAEEQVRQESEQTTAEVGSLVDEINKVILAFYDQAEENERINKLINDRTQYENSLLFLSDKEKQNLMDEYDLRVSMLDLTLKAKKAKIDTTTEEFDKFIKTMQKTGEEALKLKKLQQGAQESFSYGWNKAFNEYTDNINNIALVGQNVFKSMTDTINTAIDDLVEKGTISWDKLIDNMIKGMIKAELQREASLLFRMGLNAITGGNFFSGIASFLGFADGGNPPVGVPSMVGERGPELFVPRTAGTIIPNNQLATMGGGQTVNYNGPYIASMSAIDTQSGIQFLAKNKQAVWATYQSANRSIPMSR